MAYVIGLDVGTTSTIGILIELPDRVVATASRPVTLSSPRAGWAEEDPQAWWENVCAITDELLRMAPEARDGLGAVGVAGMVPAVVLLDEEGRPLRPSIQQSDSRCMAQVAEIAREIDPKEVLRMTGNGLNQQLVTAKLRWIEANEPDVFGRVRCVLGSYDYVNWRLTGERAVEANWALEGGFVDLNSGRIAPELVALGHIGPDVLPPMRRSTEIVGRVTPGAAAQTGLPAGLPVIAGCADHVASAYAAGVVREGDVLLKFGGAGDILAASATARPDSRIFLDYHAIPGLFMPNGCMASTGSLLNWAAATLGGGEQEAAARAGRTLHQHLDRMAAGIAPGSDGVRMLPYFLGEKSPIHDPMARGVVAGLSLNHDAGHLWRAALEGTAFAFRHHVEVFAELGHRAETLLASDGGSSSPVWMQIVADVHQKPVQVLDGHPGSCLGAAWLAAIGAGLTEEWTGVARFVRKGRLFEPDPATATCHEEAYQAFRGLYEALAGWFRR